jgi:hypothetical protein
MQTPPPPRDMHDALLATPVPARIAAVGGGAAGAAATPGSIRSTAPEAVAANRVSQYQLARPTRRRGRAVMGAQLRLSTGIRSTRHSLRCECELPAADPC